MLTFTGCFSEMAHIIESLRREQLCSNVLYKELYLPAEEINGMHHTFIQHSLLLSGKVLWENFTLP